MKASFLFLHGFAGGPETFQDVTYASRPRSLLPYLSGHGDLPAVEWATSFDEEIARLAALLRTDLGAAVHLVGYSLGARVGLGLLVRFPELVLSATLVGVHPGLRSDSERSERRARDRDLIEMLERDGIEAFVNSWEKQPIFASQARLRGELWQRQRSVRLAHSAQGLAHAMATLGLAQMPDFWPFLPTIDRPVTLVVGAEDEKFHKLARDMNALLPRASVIVAPACGHNVALEAPDLLSRTLSQRSEFS